MADESLTVLQAALLEAVRPSARGRLDIAADVELDRLEIGRRRHVKLHGPRRFEDCADPGCREASCLRAAVVVDGGRRVWYPCRSHAGGFHHYAAWWPKCVAPWCRLPYSHYIDGTMHDIPPGTVVLVGPNEAVSRG